MIDTGTTTTFKWLLGWGLLLIILGVLNKTRLGHVLIYYSLVLLLFGVVVTQYKWIGETLGSVGTIGPA